MIQDIKPQQYRCEFSTTRPKDADLVAVFEGREALLLDHRYPTVAELRSCDVKDSDLVYLFAVDDIAVWLLWEVTPLVREKLEAAPFDACRQMEGVSMPLIGATALHLYRWYRMHRFCGACGAPARHDAKERAMRCASCGALAFPMIAPAVAVGVRNGNRIILTKYAHKETPRYALIAGFVEIGETLEDTVRREVLEEVGLKVKNIRYCGNQPWGFSGNLMMGYWADLDGEDDTIVLDREELREGIWVERENVPETPNALDLTHTMMNMFRNGTDPRD